MGIAVLFLRAEGLSDDNEGHMKKNIGLILIAFSIISILTTGVFAQPRLTKYAWELTQLNGRDMGHSNASLYFDEAKKGFNGNAGCNRMSGSYSVNRNAIKFSKIITTKMFCSKPGVMQEEADFTRALSAATRYTITRETMRIYSGRKKILEFQRQYPSITLTSSVLVAKKWFLDGQPAPKSTKVPQGAFIAFDKVKGSVGGNTGCNVFGGSYKADGDLNLTITDVISTMRACIEDDRMDTERKLLDGLRKADRYDIEDDTLSLFAGKTLLLTFTGYDK
jgi:heat shock protein HslJ